MTIQTRYITADREYTGIDLMEEFHADSNPSDQINAFLKRIEDRMEVFLNAHFFKRVSDEWPQFSDFQKQHYKLALIEQAYYVFKNGDISSDSGYDPDKGIVASKHALTELVIAPNAKDHLRMTGLWSAHIGMGGFFGPWVI